MAKSNKNKKKVINDLLDKKFNELNKIVGGIAIACSVKTPPTLCGPQVCTIVQPKCNLC